MSDIRKLVSQGNNHLEEGYLEKALDCFEQALKIKKDDPDIWNKKGIILRSMGRYQEAVKCFDESLKLDPRDKNAS